MNSQDIDRAKKDAAVREFGYLPQDADSARAIGENHFFTGTACKKGHYAPRYVSNGACVKCVKDRVSSQRMAKGGGVSAITQSISDPKTALVDLLRRAVETSGESDRDVLMYLLNQGAEPIVPGLLFAPDQKQPEWLSGAIKQLRKLSLFIDNQGVYYFPRVMLSNLPKTREEAVAWALKLNGIARRYGMFAISISAAITTAIQHAVEDGQCGEDVLFAWVGLDEEQVA